MIYFTSDLHLNHDREFIWKPRGFNSVDEMNRTIIDNINSVVGKCDTLYILGDLMLNSAKGAESIALLEEIKCGEIYIILGNHDTDNRVGSYYLWLSSIEPTIGTIKYANMIKYGGYNFYLSHYPTFTANLEKESLKQCTINLYGHTHQKSNFYNDIPFMYHVGVDSHNCMPVSIEEVIRDIKVKYNECKEML